MSNNCPDPLICSINCASDKEVDINTMKVIPFNNYGNSYIRVRTCLMKLHTQKLSRYSEIIQPACIQENDFQVCSRLIPPSTFVPVALPLQTTYIEIDFCVIQYNGGIENYICSSTDPITRIYGNTFLFPNSFDVAQTNSSVCTSNSKQQ